jgi:hypothetical protein
MLRWQDDIKGKVKLIGYDGLDWTAGSSAGSFERGDEHPDSINGGEYLTG